MARPISHAFFLLLFLPRLAFSADEKRGNLVSELQARHNIPEHEAAEQIEKVFSLIREDLKQGRSVEVRNFGTFNVRERITRQKKNDTFASPKAPAAKRRYPQFLAANSLKDDVNLPMR